MTSSPANRFSTLAPIILVLMITGCQGTPVVAPDDRYFTWVDELGRVRYSPMTDAEEPVEASSEAIRASGETPGSGDAEYTLDKYPDADQLAEDGYVRPGARQPYYTWRDAQGNVRVSYYRPETGPDQPSGHQESATEITPARVYRAGDQGGVGPDADPEALAILGIEADSPDYLEAFSRSCCRHLDTSDHDVWQEGREFAIHITEDTQVYRFHTGPSRFRILSLPGVSRRGDFIMVLRSYNRKGVFVPSLAFLDSNMVPVRLVTDLVASYQPGNWHRRGYLEARVPVFPGSGERWLVIFTRNEDMQGQTLVETEQGTLVIPHADTGELGLERQSDN